MWEGCGEYVMNNSPSSANSLRTCSPQWHEQLSHNNSAGLFAHPGIDDLDLGVEILPDTSVENCQKTAICKECESTVSVTRCRNAGWQGLTPNSAIYRGMY
jgi:hypothetical protein